MWYICRMEYNIVWEWLIYISVIQTTSQALCWVKEARQKWVQIVWFHFCEAQNKQNWSVLFKVRLMVTLGEDSRLGGSSGQLPGCWSHCFLILVLVLWVCSVCQIHWAVHSWNVHIFVCILDRSINVKEILLDISSLLKGPLWLPGQWGVPLPLLGPSCVPAASLMLRTPHSSREGLVFCSICFFLREWPWLAGLLAFFNFSTVLVNKMFSVPLQFHLKSICRYLQFLIYKFSP